AQRRRALSSSTGSRLVYFALMTCRIGFCIQSIVTLLATNRTVYFGETPYSIYLALGGVGKSQHPGMSPQPQFECNEALDAQAGKPMSRHRQRHEFSGPRAMVEFVAFISHEIIKAFNAGVHQQVVD